MFSLPSDTHHCRIPARPPPDTLIPRLRDALSVLDARMAALSTQRRDIESRLEQAVRLQSPVLRLPSELLSSIFVIGVLGNPTDDDQGDGAVMLPALMLVCRYWLQVALATPCLWSQITVSPLHSLEQARRKLARSSSCPLDININFAPRTDYSSNNSGVMEQVVRSMDIFSPAIWRIKSLRLSVPNRSQAHAVLLRCQADAPLLEVLSVRVFHALQDDSHSAPPLPLFNGSTPRLRSCSFTSFNFGWDISLVSRLRVLKLGGYFNAHTPSANVLLGILRECPQLEEFALRNFSDVDCAPCFTPTDFEFPTLTKIAHLPKLKRVVFYCAGFALTRQLMAQFSFPNLESLELSYLENVTPILQLLYTQSLTYLPLRKLRIESCLFNEQKLLALLRRTSLVELELVDVEDASSGLLRGLSSSQPWICPKLESLTLDGCTSLDWDSLRTFVESRLPANSPVYHQPRAITSASVAAAEHALRSRSQFPAAPRNVLGPLRLRCIDVTRCSQISKEMVQWLRMYVAQVKCERAKGVWGEPVH
ncbi:F-box domain-containing protein [Mycena indigotica]|uniref:F-box domain-containing protein n=1 Tax=Mycena indigotica TaxID=2126181 RepID=A0A8H6SIK1_9AGAR|nr:F-box domain-containing protein [Mycena indigotica]KAF7298992.1 F-box domain-containing protein [Mycena indigotica]